MGLEEKNLQYDPETGRWTSKEPLGFAGSRNFYVYTKGDPVNYVDRTGLLIDREGNFVRGPIWNKKFYFPAGSQPTFEEIKEVVMRAFQDLLCASYLSHNEYAFRIDIDNDNNTKGPFIWARNPVAGNEISSNPGNLSSGGTITNGHTHIYDGRVRITYTDGTIYIPPAINPRDVSEGDINFIKAYKYKYAFIANKYGELMIYDRNTDNEKNPPIFIENTFDFSSCVCKE